jgi:hypothetical protein
MTDPMPEVGDPYDDATVADYDDTRAEEFPTVEDFRALIDLRLDIAKRDLRMAEAHKAAQAWKDASAVWRERARTAEERLHAMRVERDDLITRLNAADPFRGMPGCAPYVAKAEPREPLRPIAIVRESGPLNPSTLARPQMPGEDRDDFDLRGEA